MLILHLSIVLFLIIVNGLLGMCNWLYRWYDPDHEADSSRIKDIFVKIIFNGIRRK